MNLSVTSRILFAGLVAGLASVYGCGGGKPLASGPLGGGGGASDGAAGSTSDGAAGSAITGAGGAAGNPPPTGGTGGSTGCGVAVGPGTGSGCNTVVAAGPCVTQKTIGVTGPFGGGGVVAAGTYELTSSTLYLGMSDGSPRDAGTDHVVGKKTIVISNVTASSFTYDEVDVLGDRTDRSHGTATISVSFVTFTPTCPAPGTPGGGSRMVGVSTFGTTLVLESGSVPALVEGYSKI